jgi:hypothetical protein
MGYELFIVRSLKIFLASLPAAPFCFQIRPALALLRVKTSTSPSPLPSPEVERESEDEDELSIFLGFIHSFIRLIALAPYSDICHKRSTPT